MRARFSTASFIIRPAFKVRRGVNEAIPAGKPSRTPFSFPGLASDPPAEDLVEGDEVRLLREADAHLAPSGRRRGPAGPRGRRGSRRCPPCSGRRRGASVSSSATHEASCASRWATSVVRRVSASLTSAKAAWIAFSYCGDGDLAVDLRDLQVRDERPAREEGGDDLRHEAPRPRPRRRRGSESSGPSVPSRAVSEIRGKKAARAAPMFAFAARSWCSAARMSGRRRRTSDGSPAATPLRVRHGAERSGRRSGPTGEPTRSWSACRSTATAPVKAATLTRAASTWLWAWRRSRSDARPASRVFADQLVATTAAPRASTCARPEVLAVGREAQVAPGHGGHERGLRGPAGLLRREVLLERRGRSGSGSARRSPAPTTRGRPRPSTARRCSPCRCRRSSPGCGTCRRWPGPRSSGQLRALDPVEGPHPSRC